MNAMLTKVKPMPNGFWYTTKWDMIRAMRSGADYIAVVVEGNSEQTIKTRAELLGSTIEIKGEPFCIQATGTVEKVEKELDVTI